MGNLVTVADVPRPLARPRAARLGVGATCGRRSPRTLRSIAAHTSVAHGGGATRAVRALLAALFAAGSLVAPRAAVAQRAAVEVVGEACDLASTLPRVLAKRGVLGPELSVRVVVDDARMIITLTDRGGTVRERRVPRSPSCAADLDLAALIIERQQRDLGLDAGDAALPPLPTELDLHLELGLRGGPEVGARIRGDVELVGRLELGRFVELLVGLRVVLPSEVAVAARAGEGSIGGWAHGAWAAAGVGFDTGKTRIFLGISAGAERTVATASGALFQRLDTDAWTSVLGMEGRYDRAVWDDLIWLSFGLAGRFRPGAPTFTVEGAASQFEVPGATLVARVGVWVRFF